MKHCTTHIRLINSLGIPRIIIIFHSTRLLAARSSSRVQEDVDEARYGFRGGPEDDPGSCLFRTNILHTSARISSAGVRFTMARWPPETVVDPS